jgi:hypothetical protein
MIRSPGESKMESAAACAVFLEAEPLTKLQFVSYRVEGLRGPKVQVKRVN